MTNLDSILKSRDVNLPTIVCLVKAMIFPVVIWIWELDSKESWMVKNWCLWSVVLEKTLGSPLDCKEIQPVHPKGDQSFVLIGRTDVEVETPILWPPDAKSWLIWKDPDSRKDLGQEEKETTAGEMVGWHHRLSRHEFVWTSRVRYGQGGVVCCGSWGCRESDMTEQLNRTYLEMFSRALFCGRAWHLPAGTWGVLCLPAAGGSCAQGPALEWGEWPHPSSPGSSCSPPT